MIGLTLALSITLFLGGLLSPVAAEAQPTAKVARVGVLALANVPPDQAFFKGLQDLGYVEGRNLVIEYRSAMGKPERLPALATELVALKLDVIVAPSTVAARAAKEATAALPIVSLSIPVTNGLVSGLARPGGNVTGLAFFSPELVGKCLEQLTQAVPGVSRVAALWQPRGHGARTERDMLERVKKAARALGVQLQLVEAKGPADFDRAFSEMTRARVGQINNGRAHRVEPLYRL